MGAKRKSMLAKPIVLKKMANYRQAMKQGKYALQLIELNYNNNCNFKCQHCFSKNLSKGERHLKLSDVRNLADQAHELGVWQWHLQGGEPLLWPDLDDVLQAIGTERFHVMITTNGSLMTAERAQRLAELGVDKISVSIDSLRPEFHDEFRCFPGALRKAKEALLYAWEAGLAVNINTVITHQNIRGQELLDIVEFAEDNKFTMLFVIATSAGAWAGKTDMLISDEDAMHILEMKKEHPIIHRDLYPLFEFEWGCRTMNGLVYITENGELLSCPFIHISMGNVLDEPLKDILARGWSVKHFRDYSPKCLAGEDRDFILRFMTKPIGKKGPVSFDEAFGPEDLYNIEPIG
jgi:MoaA/NifB/PqqE/SkfB family radical SAM enzyme